MGHRRFGKIIGGLTMLTMDERLEAARALRRENKRLVQHMEDFKDILDDEYLVQVYLETINKSKKLIERLEEVNAN